MTLLRPTPTRCALVGICLVLMAPGCDCGQTAGPDTLSAPASGTLPGLARLHVSDLTEPAERAIDLSVDVDQVVRAAMLAEGHFVPTSPDADWGCRVKAELYYVLVQNGVITPTATAGQARIAMEANARCPYAGETQIFRAEFVETRPFGGDHGRDAEQALRSLLDRIAHMGASALAGQVQMRNADDDAVLTALATASGMGTLMEAASEAGERGLRGAVNDLVKLTEHGEDAVALRAGAALGQLGVDAPEVLSALARMTEGPNTKRHFTAVQALGDIGGPNAGRYLQSLAVGHPIATMRKLAREAQDRARDRDPGNENTAPP